MTEEAQAGVNPELRARAAAMMTNISSLTGGNAEGKNGAPAPLYLDDETEGSSDEQPPTVCPSLFTPFCSGIERSRVGLGCVC